MTETQNEIISKSSEILSSAYASNWSEESACVFSMATEVTPNEFFESPVGMKEVFAALADASKKGHALSGHVLTVLSEQAAWQEIEDKEKYGFLQRKVA